MDRRLFLKAAGSAAALSLLAGYGEAIAGVPSKRPNFVFILTDDQPNDMLGCAGNALMKTPHIDALASAGTVFDNMFVTSPICPSSRASILTGVTETRHHYTFGHDSITQALGRKSYLALLKASGYRTAFIGKFGVAFDNDIEKDFIDTFDARDRPYVVTGADGRPTHIDEINVRSAVDFIHASEQETPFVLQLNFSSPHAEDADKQQQYHPVQWSKDMYKGVVFPPPREDAITYFEKLPDFMKHSMNRERYYWRWDTPAKYQKNMREFYQTISGIDHMVGMVMDALKTRGLLDNTIVIYASDNGVFMGDRGFSDKFNHFEESLRVPLIISDFRSPLAHARHEAAIALNVDIPATILNMAGLKIPGHYQGASLSTFVSGKPPTAWRTEFFCQDTFKTTGIDKWTGVRGTRYVYARYFEQQPVYEFLYDLKTDPTEFVNLAHEPAYAKILGSQRILCDRLGAAMA